MGCNYLGGFDMNKIVHLYNDRASVLTRAHLADDGLKDLPNHLRLTARDYLNGEPRELSRATFFRHRSGLLPYGIDISVPNNVALFKPRVRVIELKAATVPSWYQLDERLVA